MAVNTTDGSNELLLWADCEFTGLPLDEGHKIIEIGALVTTASLQEIDSYESFVKYDWNTVRQLMDSNPWWTGRDADKERMKLGVESGRLPGVVDTDLAEMTDSYFGDSTEKPPLCGNSVHSDKKHIDEEFPLFASKLDYRIIDTTSLKIIAYKYKGLRYPDKTYRHYALDDIRESVDELRYLLKNLGIVDLTKIA